MLTKRDDHPDVVTAFAELFGGSKEAYGRDSGGCYRVVAPIWEDIWLRHLRGDEAIGVYPLVQVPCTSLPERAHAHTAGGTNEWCVKWGCVDLDIKSPAKPSGDYVSESECHTAAVNLGRVLAAQHVTSWIERTKSCGRHVWVFSLQWAPAKTMRRALLVSCGVAGVSTREINPKQESLAEGQLGNYVRLPYPGALAQGFYRGPQTIIADVGDGYGTFNVREFVPAALAARTSPQILESIAAKWKPPAPVSPIEWVEAESHVVDLVLRVNRKGRAVFYEGPADGDKSRGLIYVAKQAKKSGLTPGEALAVIGAASWNKYKGRHDEERWLRDCVERAWRA